MWNSYKSLLYRNFFWVLHSGERRNKKMNLKERHAYYMQKREEEKKEIKDLLIDAFIAIVVGYPTLYLLLAIANTFR